MENCEAKTVATPMNGSVPIILGTLGGGGGGGGGKWKDFDGIYRKLNIITMLLICVNSYFQHLLHQVSPK